MIGCQPRPETTSLQQNELVGSYSQSQNGKIDLEISQISDTLYLKYRTGKRWSDARKAEVLPLPEVEEELGIRLSGVDLVLKAGSFIFFKVQAGATTQRLTGKGDYTFSSDYYALFELQETPLYKVE